MYIALFLKFKLNSFPQLVATVHISFFTIINLNQISVRKYTRILFWRINSTVTIENLYFGRAPQFIIKN
jgi:hypothetical protein